MTTQIKDLDTPQRFRLLRGSYIQAKYPEVAKIVRRMENLPRNKRGLEHMTFEQLEGIAKQVGCPVEVEDDEHSLIKRLTQDQVYNCKDPARNIITTTINLELRFGREKFQNLDALSGADPNYAATQERLAQLEAENAQLRAQLGSNAPSPDPSGIDFNKLEKMTMEALKQYAVSDIGMEDVDETWTKKQLIQAIRATVASV